MQAFVLSGLLFAAGVAGLSKTEFVLKPSFAALLFLLLLFSAYILHVSKGISTTRGDVLSQAPLVVNIELLISPEPNTSMTK